MSYAAAPRRWPASHAQKRILFFERSRPGMGAYNVARAFDLDVPTDLRLAARAFDLVVARHPVLRQRFEDADDEVWAIDDSRPPCRIEPLTSDPTVNALSELDEASAVVAGRPFDTALGPLFRLAGANLANGESRLVLVIHHTCVDDVSVNLVIQEWTQAYQALKAGRAPVYADLREAFSRFVAWERELMSTPAGQRARDLLADELRNAETTCLALREISAKSREPRDGHIEARLPRELITRVEEFARSRLGTPFQVMSTAFVALLERYCDTSDVFCAIAVGNRRLSSLRHTVGDFVNTAPLRVQIEDEATFQDLFAVVRRKILFGLDKCGVPFDEVVRAASQASGGQDAPRIMFLENLEPERFSPDEGVCRRVWTPPTGAAKLDLTVSFVRHRGGGATLRLEYDRKVVDQTTAARLIRSFVTLLDAGLGEPSKRVADLDALADEDRAALDALSNGPVECQEALSVHTAILEQCRDVSGRTALIFPGGSDEPTRSLTYGEMEVWSRRIAAKLIALGVTAGQPVGVLSERCVGLPTAILGVLRAGGAYLPLDPDHPDARLETILTEARPLAVLVSRSLADSPVLQGQVCVIIEDLEAGDLPELAVTPVSREQPSYVLYTSGSTGRPKGVVNTHRGIENRLAWMQRAFPIGVDDVVLQKTPISFDVSVWELLWPLMHGARMVLARPGEHRDCAALARRIAEQQVTLVHFVPSMLRLFLDEATPADCASLRQLICSGEALASDLVRRWRSGFPCPVHNLYGPTEAAIDVTAWACDADEPEPAAPIGRPIDNTCLHVLDRRRRPMPPGAIGEIFIGGVNLAAGYLARPDLTAAVFVTVEGLPGGPRRLYRTGDLGYWRADGALQFAGRIDEQIKLNGVRIELEELEQLLREHPAVADAAVALVRDQGDNFLAAHIVRSAGVDAPLEAIATWMRTRLPASMTPTQYREIAILPRTLSGKTDRKSLPAIDRHVADDTPITSPRDELERRLLTAWSRVLQRNDIGIDQNFFALGGDSLRSLRVAAALRAEGLAVAVDDLLSATTIRDLAAQIAPRRPLEVGRLQAQAQIARFEAPRLIQTLWHNSRENPLYRTYVTSFLIKARLETRALEGAIGAAIVRHPMLRASLGADPDHSRPMIQIHTATPGMLEVEDLRALDATEQVDRLTAWFDQQSRAWNFEQPTACRFVAHRRDEAHFQFTLIEPWLDGWSVQTLVTEILSDYAAGIGVAPPLDHPVPTVQYAAHVLAEQDALGDVAHRDFWIARLRQLLPTLIGDGRAPARIVLIPAALGSDASKLRAVAADLGVPLKTALLAIHLAALSMLSGAATAVSGVMFNGRPEMVGAENVLGLYLNALPLSAAIRGRSWEALCQACWREEVEITPWRRFPSDELRRLAGEPLFDALFNFTDFNQMLDLPRGDRFAVLERTGFDQTYMSLCAQFGTELITRAVTLDLEVDGDLVTRLGAERLVGVYQRAIAAFCRDPRAVISPTELLGTDLAIMRAWPCVEARTAEGSLYEMFVAQCASRPRAPALCSRGRNLDYGELKVEVNRIGGALQELGAARGDRIGIHLPRSWEAVASILACAGLGAVFVPLPMEAPAERISFIVEDANLKAVVAYGWRSSSPMSVAVLDLNDGGRWASPCGAPDWPPQPGAEAPLHILYTSGSTSRPKGVETSQAVVLNRLSWMWRRFPFERDELLAHKTSLGFVDAIWEIFGALLKGCATRIISEEDAADPASLALAVEGCTRLSLVPSVAQAMLHDAPDLRERLGGLRVLILSGETLPPDTAEALRHHLPATRLLNLYGSTETGGDATFHEISEARAEPNLVGRPLPGVGTWVVDEDGDPVPIGVRGEIVVSGACLANGYVGWAARSPDDAARWTIDPSGAAAWRTGDLGYFHSDGALTIQGRKDRQLKVRGVRIEPAEIEAVLARIAHVRRAVVVLDPAGSLTAIVESAELLDLQAVRGASAKQLPPAMTPTRFIQVKRMPTTLTGKLDLTSLLAKSGGVAAPAPTAAITPMEALLIEVMSEVFPDKPLGRGSDFFDLGGHSLLAGSLVTRLRRRLQASIPLRTIFQNPVVADLALALEGLSEQQAN